jgi:hypothetical protein
MSGTAEVALNPTATTAQALGVAFSMKWVDRLQRLGDEVFFKFIVQHDMPLHSGKQLVIEKSTALSVATTALIDDPVQAGSSPNIPTSAPFERDYTLSNIVLTPVFYGNDMGWTTRQEITHQDVVTEKRTNELAINAVETMAQLVANEFDNLTPLSWASLTFARMVYVGRLFRTNKVRGFDELGGNFVGAIGPFGWEDILTEGTPKYSDNFQTRDGSNQIASGQLEKAFLGFQLFVTNYNLVSGSSLESQYFWGYDGLVSTELVAGVVGLRGRRIPGSEKMPSLIGYLIPAEANNNDHYGLKNWAVWRGGPIDFSLTTSTNGDRVFAATVNATD